jgi:hypothetical protein
LLGRFSDLDCHGLILTKLHPVARCGSPLWTAPLSTHGFQRAVEDLSTVNNHHRVHRGTLIDPDTETVANLRNSSQHHSQPIARPRVSASRWRRSMPDQHVVTVYFPNPVKWNPPLLSGGIDELKHPLLGFRKVNDSQRHPLDLSVESVNVPQLEFTLAELGIMPDAGEQFVDGGHGVKPVPVVLVMPEWQSQYGPRAVD